ncbi:sensor histidine kinase [Streptomyces sp. NBC_01012]|uniref:sensor histidine kinase n=1 Tax=Streptomyces sp. NBC_01012 TaxID=2903717 RepID=UPI00386F9F11|nr:histidine kinase [Streptomyces sp. NBC_01012]
MTETKTRSPEHRIATGAIAGLRQDLFHDVLDYRPMGPLGTDGPVIRRLPGTVRKGAVWFPHAVVGVVALISLLDGVFSANAYSPFGLTTVVTGFLPPAVLLMTMVRPLLAFWVSIASTPLVAAVSHGSWPWEAGPFACHLGVLIVVAARTRPRTAAWMWLITLFVGSFLGNFGPPYSSTTEPMAIASAFGLLLVAVVQIRREAQREVTVQRTVTAVERDRRTLLEERTTIARELHDVVAHHMSVVAIQAEAAPYRVENPPPELEQAFATIRENAVAALTELRRVLGVVRAEDYEAPDAPQPTLAEIDRLLDNVRETGLETEKTVTGAVRELPQGVELSAYRIVQEALSNTLRHAPGAAARVEIGYVLGGLGVRIVNGAARGLVKPSPGAGHGITGMRERVAMLNGDMTAGSTDDGGYEVVVFLPVPAQRESVEDGEEA